MFEPWGWSLIAPTETTRLLDLADYLVKVGAALAAAWAFAVKVGKPAYEFRAKILERRNSVLAQKIRGILEPELQDLTRLQTCTDELEVVLKRQREVFLDLDNVLGIVTDNRDRIDETNDLLNLLGFSSDRRAANAERREEFDRLLTVLRNRNKVRARAEAEAAIVIDGAADAL